MVKKNIFLFLAFIILLSLDYLFYFKIKSFNIMFNDVIKVNVFLYILTVSFFLVFEFSKKRKIYSPIIYFGLSFFKMTTSLIFLYFTISGGINNLRSYIFHFFIFYFAYLFIEIFILFKDSRQ